MVVSRATTGLLECKASRTSSETRKKPLLVRCRRPRLRKAALLQGRRNRRGVCRKGRMVYAGNTRRKKAREKRTAAQLAPYRPGPRSGGLWSKLRIALELWRGGGAIPSYCQGFHPAPLCVGRGGKHVQCR